MSVCGKQQRIRAVRVWTEGGSLQCRSSSRPTDQGNEFPEINGLFVLNGKGDDVTDQAISQVRERAYPVVAQRTLGANCGLGCRGVRFGFPRLKLRVWRLRWFLIGLDTGGGGAALFDAILRFVGGQPSHDNIGDLLYSQIRECGRSDSENQRMYVRRGIDRMNDRYSGYQRGSHHRGQIVCKAFDPGNRTVVRTQRCNRDWRR